MRVIVVMASHVRASDWLMLYLHVIITDMPKSSSPNYLVGIYIAYLVLGQGIFIVFILVPPKSEKLATYYCCNTNDL